MGDLAKSTAGFVGHSSAAARYGVAVVSVLVFVAIKLLLAETPIPQSPFLLLSAAVMVAAWFGGLGPGLLATALATAAGDYFFWSPFGSFTGPGLNALPLALFALQGVLISSLAQALRSATTRAESSVLEAKSHRAALQESERRFRTLVQNSSDIITVVDAEGTISYVSPAVERVTGYRPEELVGKSLFDHVRPDDLEQGRRTFAEIWSQPVVHPPFELRVLHKDGSWRHSEFLLNNLLDDPSVRGVVINQRDITERKQAEEALSQSEERYRAVVEQSAEGLYLVDSVTRRILETNPALQNMLGYTADELCGMELHEIVAHDRADVEANVEHTLREGTRFIRERGYRRKDGSVVEVEIAASAIDYGGKKVICAAIRDITERKKTEEALRRSFDSLLALYEAGQILGSSLERDEIGLRLLEFAERVSGLETAILSLVDKQGRMSEWRSVGPEEVLAAVRERPEVRSAVDEVSKGGRARAVELRRPPNSKSQMALTGVFVPLRARGRVIGVLGAYGPPALAHKETRDALSSLAVQGAGALENARLYEELAERERELHDLVGRIMAAQEEERRRVAYEVHDGFTQTAAAAYRRLALFAEHHPPESARDREELEEAVALVRRTVGEARRVIANLRPTTLDDFGLANAVRMQTEELRAEGYETTYEETLGEARLPTMLETALFRVAQEALTNVRKHAQTDRVSVALGLRDGTVRLEVSDRGRGFAPAEAGRGAGPGERVGLSSMRERIALLGGALEIRSEPGTGTTVVASVPLRATGEEVDGGGY